MSPAVVTGLLFMMVLMFKTDSADGICTLTPVESCGSVWYKLDDKRCMMLSGTTANFKFAQFFCELQGGTLVSIRNEADFYQVMCPMLKKAYEAKTYKDVKSYWIGGKLQDGVFHWVDGSGPVTFQKWGPGQPDFYQQAEECLEMSWKKWGDWNDLSCSASREFVCQKDI